MIPKSFKIVNRRYSVKAYDKGYAAELNRYGDCDRGAALIRLDTKQPTENLQHSFYHELAHALLYASTKPKLSNNEEFVDSLGALIHQFMQTRSGEF